MAEKTPPPQTFEVCEVCGSLVRDLSEHSTWHARVGKLLARDVDVRWVSVTLPAMALGTREDDIVWPESQGGPLPTDRYSLTPTVHLPAASLLGKTEVSIKAGSRTREGCTVLLGASLLVPAGAVVEVVAVHYPLAGGA